MTRRLGIVLATVGTLGMVACEAPAATTQSRVDPDMLRIAQAMQPCEDGLAAVAADPGSDPIALRDVRTSAAAACSNATMAIWSLSDAEGDATVYEAARQACDADMEARAGAMSAVLLLSERQEEGATTTDEEQAIEQTRAAADAAQAACTAALGAPADQLRADGAEAAS